MGKTRDGRLQGRLGSQSSQCSLVHAFADSLMRILSEQHRLCVSVAASLVALNTAAVFPSHAQEVVAATGALFETLFVCTKTPIT